MQGFLVFVDLVLGLMMGAFRVTYAIVLVVLSAVWGHR